jgi:transcriptional regulator with XRE-family HTH domain
MVMERSQEDKELLVNLGKKIREVRVIKNFTQMKLAALCNLDTPNISRLERGNTNPTFLILKRIADILQVRIIDLIPNVLPKKYPPE